MQKHRHTSHIYWSVVHLVSKYTLSSIKKRRHVVGETFFLAYAGMHAVQLFIVQLG